MSFTGFEFRQKKKKRLKIATWDFPVVRNDQIFNPLQNRIL